MYWAELHATPSRAYNANCPTLKELAMLYDYPIKISNNSADDITNLAEYWVRMQLVYLFTNSSCKDASLAKTIEPFARSFASEAKDFKLTELMLFFSYYMAGKLNDDDSYVTFSTKRIGDAFRKFRQVRDKQLLSLEREACNENISESVEYPTCFENSLVWSQHIVKLAANGNVLANTLLMPPVGETSRERMKRIYQMAEEGNAEANEIINN